MRTHIFIKKNGVENSMEHGCLLFYYATVWQAPQLAQAVRF